MKKLVVIVVVLAERESSDERMYFGTLLRCFAQRCCLFCDFYGEWKILLWDNGVCHIVVVFRFVDK